MVKPRSPLPTSPLAKILVVDGTNSVYRAFFAIPNLRAPDGSPTNAAYGFENMLAKVLREEEPDAVLVVFDARGKTFRHGLYADYKAGRDAQPEDLAAQLPVVRELVEAHRIPIVEVAGVEADDVIASIVARAPEQTQVAIVSTDKDLMQLVSERVTLLDGMKDRRFGPAEVEERFGVAPDRILDLRALVGDPSDNIPGVKGIGEKGAAKLLQEWGDLDHLLEHAEEVKAKRARTALLEHADEARLSRRLSELVTDVDLPIELDDARRRDPDAQALRAIYERCGFTRLLDALDAAVGEAAASAPGDVEVEIVRDPVALDALMEEMAKLPCLPLHVIFDEAGALAGSALGLAVARDAGRAVYLALGEGGLDLADLAARLESLIGVGGAVAWTSTDAKQAQILFAERGVELSVPHFDAEIAAFLLDSAGPRTLATVASQVLGAKVRTWEELAGRGAKAKRAAELPPDEVARFAAETACALHGVRPPLEERLDRDGLTPLFEEVELPLTAVLARVERNGVRIDEARLEALSAEYAAQLADIEREVYALAGEEFLISSPKQLQQILFEKLKLPVIKKTKTGYSTDEDVLEQLSSQHDLPQRILAYRRLTKLKNTYVDALPPLVNPRTGRIHPTFNQLGAATGRLSATHPNVQNIPIRTPEGIRIREAFVPAEGCVLLSADYSQVELRILAHYSGDESLIDAFEKGEDIHRRTAAEVAGIEPEAVDAEQRARAKAVNFGIIYGSSAFGLARQLGIASAEAQATIDAYFERYRGVRRFLDETIASAREQGFVTTFLGRRRPLPDLGSRNRALRQAAERMAVNTVIQGTAADLIKKAMVEIDAALASEGHPARMILQVHDELVFELPPERAEGLGAGIRERMEGVLALRVPLVVDVGVGGSWREAH
ncbi:MAG: DNA polymerase I [Myxococcota bacterium]